MAEGNDTIRELLSGFNSMQAQLGLTPSAGQAGGFPMAATPMPQVKSPGEFSQEMMQRSTQQMQMTVQSAQQLRMTPGPGVLGLSPGGMPDIGRPPAPVNSAAGAYSAQYQERMQDIESRYLSPYQAQGMARGAGQAGFQNMPSPIFQTAPSMGIFRPSMTMPPSIPLAREAPMFPTPFTPNIPTPRFQSRTEMGYNQRAMEDERMFAGTMAAAPTVANLAVGGGTAAIAGGIGGRIGGAIGGARGRAIGQIGGLIGGGALGFGVLGGMAEQGMQQGVVDPIMQRRAFGRQLEQVSKQFVVGGSDLNTETGRGMTTKAAIGLAGQMQQDVKAGETGGFNMRDMMKMTGMAAEGGMLDMAQNGPQVAQQMRNVAKGLQSFMQIAQEPDVRRAMQQMSAFRSMGLTIPETNVAAQNAQKFARMAGTTVQGLQQQAGMPGAMTFQQLGMTAGLGMQVGHASAGYAAQAVAGGAYTPGQLAMAGGKSGITQTMTEAAGAGLGVNFPMLAMLERGGEGGALSINKDMARKIMRGDVSLSDQARMGAQNVQDLGGETVITELSTRLNELRNELGQTLGPQGSSLLAMRQATNIMKEVPNLSFGAALKQLGMSTQQARTLEVMGQSPQFWQNVREQHEVNIRQMRDDEASRRDSWQEKSEISDRMSAWWKKRGWTDRVSEMTSSIGQGISEWWTDRGASARAAEQGGQYVGRSRELEVANRRQQKSLESFIGSGGYQRFAQGNQAELNRGTGRIVPTTGEQLGGLYNTGLGVITGAATALSGGLLGGVVGGVASQIGSNAPGESNYAAALQARGGISGALGGAFTGLSMAAGANPMEAVRAHTEARQAAEMGGMLSSGARLTSKQKAAITGDLRSAYQEYGRAEGVSVDASKDRMGTMVEAAVKRFEQNAAWYGDKAVTSGEMKTDMIEALVASGEDRKVATRFVTEKFNAGLGSVVMNKAKPFLSEKAKAAWAKTEKAVGYEGKLAGSDLKQVQENAEKMVEGVKEATGFYEWSNASKASWDNFKDQATTGSADEMMMMAALGQGVGTGDATEEGKRLEKLMLQKLGPEKYQKLKDRMATKFADIRGTDKAEMYEEYGKKLGKEGAKYEDVRKNIESVQDKLKGAISGTAIAKGAAKWREAGITAFGEMFGKGGIEGTLKALKEDPEQMRKLKEQSPEMAKLVEEYEGAEGDEGKAAAKQKMLQRLFKQGGGGQKTGGTLGGKGVGGAAEAREKEQMGLEAEIEEAIKKGKPGQAFAKAVPSFAKATGDLKDATKDLKNTVQAARLLFKMPGTG